MPGNRWIPVLPTHLGSALTRSTADFEVRPCPYGGLSPRRASSPRKLLQAGLPGSQGKQRREEPLVRLAARIRTKAQVWRPERGDNRQGQPVPHRRAILYLASHRGAARRDLSAREPAGAPRTDAAPATGPGGEPADRA